MSVTVYSKPACVQCGATYRALDNRGIEYKTVDISEDVVALEKIKGMGFRQAPVVVTELGSWSGFRPDKINEIAVGPGNAQVAANA